MIHERAAPAIIEWLHVTEDALVGSVLLTFNGEAGLCKGVRLDETHGLCFTLDDKPERIFRDGLPPVRWYPVSTIRSIA